MTVHDTITNYAALDLVLWQEQGALVLSPKFQRRPVWSTGAKSYLIDTILRGYPVPPLHVRLSEAPHGEGVLREVIDGQQRLRTLFDFYDGNLRLGSGLRLSNGDRAPWAGKTFGQLSPDEQSRLKLYSFQAYQYSGIDDALVLEIFARINTYSVKLNAQELRNGKWFGDFKQTAYALALEFLPLWREYAIFTEDGIARMREAELVSELLVLELDGLQDKKASVDNFYAQLDDGWGTTARTWELKGGARPAAWLSPDEASRRLRSVLNTVTTAVGPVLRASEFRRVPLFYTLCAAVYHRLFGLPDESLPTPRRALAAGDAERLRVTIGELSDLLADKPSEDDLRGWRRDFLVASSRQTDNVGPRRTRLRVLWEQADLG